MWGRWARFRSSDTGGFVLPATVIFVFVVMIATLGFSSMVTYETKGALYRQASVEAFHLADGAVERAKARLMNDAAWRGAIAGAAEGDGTYDMSVADTSVAAYGPVIKLVGTGHVGLSDRRVEEWVQLDAAALDYALFVGGDAQVPTNLCLSGEALVVGNAYGGSPALPPRFVCGGTYQEFVSETPPGAATDSTSFPGATYYTVRGSSRVPPRALVFRDGVEVPGIDFSGVLTYGSNTFRYRWANATVARQWFDPVTGIFRLMPPDSFVVVNFGEMPMVNPPGAAGLSSVLINGQMPSGTPLVISTTIINARFVGTVPAQRTDPAFWRGGATDFRNFTLLPTHGLAVLAGNLSCTAAQNVVVGTAASPALIYAAGPARISSNMRVVGSLISLGSFRSGGQPRLTYDEDFLDRLGSFLQENGSGVAHVLRWRETTAPA